MKKSSVILFFLIIGLLNPSILSASGEGWLTDFEEAKAKAQAEGKHILIDFTGSDWCGWCIKLNDEVFSKEAFKTYAEEKFVLLEIDFPRGKKQSKEVKAQNEKLAKQFGIRGFPTIVILKPNGQLLKKTGYQKGGPSAYIAHLEEIIKGNQLSFNHPPSKS